ncbi:hypothetical protein HanIR_Chr11g0537001 [Helianthus annuus]|nr:hypothetical protein HanIR_Chr11g0537001 [Helianthus annuus]
MYVSYQGNTLPHGQLVVVVYKMDQRLNNSLHSTLNKKKLHSLSPIVDFGRNHTNTPPLFSNFFNYSKGT